MTYDDSLKPPNEGRRNEIFDGTLLISPTPEVVHQHISRNLEFILHPFTTEHSPSQALDALADAVLSVTTVAQPDIVFTSAYRPHFATG